MAQIFYDSDNSTLFELTATATDILTKLVPHDQLSEFEVYFKARKIGRDQKLSDVKGVTAGKTLRVLGRTSSRTSPPNDLREQVVKLDNRIKKFGMFEERIMLQYLYKEDVTQNLLKAFPIILDEPILFNVVTDFSLICAMAHEVCYLFSVFSLSLLIFRNMDSSNNILVS